jgi:hypothetical protein
LVLDTRQTKELAAEQGCGASGARLNCGLRRKGESRQMNLAVVGRLRSRELIAGEEV